MSEMVYGKETFNFLPESDQGHNSIHSEMNICRHI